MNKMSHRGNSVTASHTKTAQSSRTVSTPSGRDPASGPPLLVPSADMRAPTTATIHVNLGPCPRGVLSRLPTEIVIRLVHFLDSPTAVCFALSCRDLCATVLDTTKIPLSILCRSRYILKSCDGVKNWSRDGDYAEMMRVLRPWILNRYSLCTDSAKYHLKNGKHYCAACEPVPRRKEEGHFDAGKWNNMEWSKLVGGVKRVISTGRRGQPVVSWVERQTAPL